MIKKISLVICLLIACVFAQCGGCLISSRAGLKAGITWNSYDPGDGTNSFSGTGSHFGFGMGMDFLKLISVDITPQLNADNYTRREMIFERTYSYSNLYFPIFVSLKAGIIPLVSPYIGLGLAFNMMASGTETLRWPNGDIYSQTQLGGAMSPAYLMLGGGVEVKLLKFRINPEFTVHIQPTDPEDPTPPPAQSINYHLSLGFYYSP
jgi:hypothetical protein